MMQIPVEVISVIKTLRKNNHQAFVVGGAVRDCLLRRNPKDWDVTTDAIPSQVEKCFSKTIPVGKKFGTVTVLVRRFPVQVTTFRSEDKYVDQRRPRSVRFHKNLTADLSRRDFTINALAYNLETEKVIDPFGGLKDLRHKKLRTVGKAQKRFNEDTLRVIRAARFLAELDFSPDPELTQAAGRSVKHIFKLSKERIRDELEKLMISKDPRRGLLWLDKTKILKCVLPELVTCKGVRQGGWHSYDVFQHTLYAVLASPQKLDLRLGLLLHDIAKPITRTRDLRGYHFYGHDKMGAEMARAILKRLRFPNELIESVCTLVRHHLFEVDAIVNNDAAIRRLIQRVGETRIDDLLEFRKADIRGCGPGRTYRPSLNKLAKRIQWVKNKETIPKLTDLAINGHDVMKWLHIKPGPQVGIVLRDLLEKVIECPTLNTKTHLKQLVENKSPDSRERLKEG